MRVICRIPFIGLVFLLLDSRTKTGETQADWDWLWEAWQIAWGHAVALVLIGLITVIVFLLDGG